MSEKLAYAAAIGGALLPAERSLNTAALDLLAVGAKIFEARNSGYFHPLEGQRAIERFGSGMNKLVEALGDVARAHDEFVKVAEKHQIIAQGAGTGEVCPIPPPSGEVRHGNYDNVVVMPAAA